MAAREAIVSPVSRIGGTLRDAGMAVAGPITEAARAFATGAPPSPVTPTPSNVRAYLRVPTEGTANSATSDDESSGLNFSSAPAAPQPPSSGLTVTDTPGLRTITDNRSQEDQLASGYAADRGAIRARYEDARARALDHSQLARLSFISAIGASQR